MSNQLVKSNVGGQVLWSGWTSFIGGPCINPIVVGNWHWNLKFKKTRLHGDWFTCTRDECEGILPMHAYKEEEDCIYLALDMFLTNGAYNIYIRILKLTFSRINFYPLVLIHVVAIKRSNWAWWKIYLNSNEKQRIHLILIRNKEIPLK